MFASADRPPPSLPPECTALGITAAHLEGRSLQIFSEAPALTCAYKSPAGREHLLTPTTCDAWNAMRDAALTDGIALQIISAHRSIARQTELIRAKLEAGLSIDEILSVLAPPGLSEHHTGRAVDIGTPELQTADPAFDATPAFAWLGSNARRFGFVLSYPKNNPQGFIYEPWHWCFHLEFA